MRVVTLGLDGSGKTAILCKLKQGEFVPTIPTIGFNVESLEFRNVKITLWDVGGQHKLRPLWKHYYLNTQVRLKKMEYVLTIFTLICGPLYITSLKNKLIYCLVHTHKLSPIFNFSVSFCPSGVMNQINKDVTRKFNVPLFLFFLSSGS